MIPDWQLSSGLPYTGHDSHAHFETVFEGSTAVREIVAKHVRGEQ